MSGLLLAFIFAFPAQAQQPPARQTLTIGYVEIAGDLRYEPIRGADRIILKTRAHPYAGAEVSIDDAAPLRRVLPVDFALTRISVSSAEEVAPAVLQAIESRGIHFFLIDAPPAAFAPLAAAVRGRDALLFNVSAPEDSLRRELCAAELVHTFPSLAMRMDALVQYLVARNWRDVIVLEGPLAADAASAAAFERSAKKFGARVVAHQRFKPGTDPRERDQNNPTLLTATNRDYDAVFVADAAFDFARQLPYRTQRPRPVVGSIDLEPVAWHWTWEHNGAPQVQARFAAHAAGRHMESGDWAAWIAVRMIVQAALRTRSTDFHAQRDFILSGAFDGDKGLAVSVRAWDHQLRQAMLLASPYAVVASAPVEGALHRTNELDTLGDDAPESPCHLDKAQTATPSR
ncbi:MAG TPA: ABC transporter substrate-binding protein [Xanthobacteraceae bacterium]|nr:ABC transporter substrate-binding protein [Xanthobacteraceae bacterium]